MDLYHIVNRGVGRCDIVNNDSDRFRFVHSLFIFNDSNPLDDNHRRMGFTLGAGERNVLVHLHAWCLMTNHYHLLLSPLKNDVTNISKFMKKLNMGYARYFNEKNNRSGYLWQGRYKKILLERDSHFIHISYYIHLNPLDFEHREWRISKVTNPQAAQTFLNTYRWSSYLDYCGKQNFPSLIDTSLLSETHGQGETYCKKIYQYLQNSERTSLDLE